MKLIENPDDSESETSKDPRARGWLITTRMRLDDESAAKFIQPGTRAEELSKLPPEVLAQVEFAKESDKPDTDGGPVGSDLEFGEDRNGSPSEDEDPFLGDTVVQVCQKLKGYKYSVFQIEEGEERKEGYDFGYVHTHIWVEAENQVKFSTWKRKFPYANIQIRRGPRRKTFNYVTKQDTRLLGPFEHGKRPNLDHGQGHRTDLERYYGLIDEGMKPRELYKKFRSAWTHRKHIESYYDFVCMVKEDSDLADRPVRAHMICGKPGIGKTRGVYDLFDRHEVFRVTDYGHPWDGLRPHHKVVVLDEFDGQIPFSDFQNVLDRYPMEMSARYFNRQAAFDTVFVVSNVPLEDQYRDADLTDDQLASLLRRFTTVSRMEEDPDDPEKRILVPDWPTGKHWGPPPAHARRPRRLEDLLDIESAPLMSQGEDEELQAILDEFLG